MKIERFFELKNSKILALFFLVLPFTLIANCSASVDSNMAEILYGICDTKEPISKLVKAPESSVFPESNFLSDTVFLRYKKDHRNWSLDQNVSDINKRYTRQAVWLVENNVLKHPLDFECMDFYVKFDFGDKQ